MPHGLYTIARQLRASVKRAPTSGRRGRVPLLAVRLRFRAASRSGVGARAGMCPGRAERAAKRAKHIRNACTKKVFSSIEPRGSLFFYQQRLAKIPQEKSIDLTRARRRGLTRGSMQGRCVRAQTIAWRAARGRPLAIHVAIRSNRLRLGPRTHAAAVEVVRVKTCKIMYRSPPPLRGAPGAAPSASRDPHRLHDDMTCVRVAL